MREDDTRALKQIDATVWPPPPNACPLSSPKKQASKFLTGYEPLDALAGLAMGAVLTPLLSFIMLFLSGLVVSLPPRHPPTSLTDVVSYGAWGIGALASVLVPILLTRRYWLFVLTFTMTGIPAIAWVFNLVRDLSSSQLK